MEQPARRYQTLRAYGVHLLTASGIVPAFLAAAQICAPRPDPRWALFWLLVAMIVDAVDGPLARRWDVKRYAGRFDGARMDDIVDYLTFTFLPLLLIWRMGWVPAPAWLWVVPAMVVSVFGFANVTAKDEAGGFFAGFPSYWNLTAYYAGMVAALYQPWIMVVVIALFAALTLAPVRLIYPNFARAPWRAPLMLGALVWVVLLLAMLPVYPAVPAWLFWVSLIYPAFYTAVSLHLDRAAGH